LDRLREIYEKHGGNLNLIAAELGISQGDIQEKFTTPPTPPARGRTPPADLGSESLRQFIVAYRHADCPVWRKEDQKKIEEARALYCAGTHEVFQGRDQNWFILYCQPRKKRCGARKWYTAFGE
jgi:hypothetical protein